MMLKINQNMLQEGLMVTGRNNESLDAIAIRIGVHSFTNHNAMVGMKDHKWGILEAEPPVSTFTPIEDYENLLNGGYLVRFYRLKALNSDEHIAAARYFRENLLGLPYPKKRKMVLLAMPVYNAIVDKTKLIPSIRMNWCSQLVKRAYLAVNPNCLDGVDHKKKEMFTPKTFENRIMFGLFEDLTDQIIVSC